MSECDHLPSIERWMEGKVLKALTELDKMVAEDLAVGTQFHPDYFRTYPNGCPILPESDD